MNRTIVFILLAILLAGAFFAWWSAVQSDRFMRENLLFQARQVALAVDPGRILALSGSDADLTDVHYLRLKEQLAGTRKATPGCEFIYLMGRREDGTVFFFADSEPVGSENESPAGQNYEEISDEDLRVFEEKIALTSGPASDRWGTWISALVPLTDPGTGSLIAVVGLNFAASEWQRKQLHAALPPLLLAITMAALFVAGAYHINRRAVLAGQSRLHRLYREKILAIIAIGSFLSLSAAWMTNEQTIHTRHQAFRQLAQDKATTIARTLTTLHHTELEALARLFEASEHVSPKEFSNYTDYLIKNPVVRTWAWVQPVPAPVRERMETQIRAEGLSEFTIWQRDVNGNHLPRSWRPSASWPGGWLMISTT